MVLYPLRGKLRVVAQVCLVGIALAVAAGLASIPEGGGQVIGSVAGVLVVLGAVWLVRGMRRQALAVDGSRLGWRRGLTDRITGWTDLPDVELATASKVNSNVSRRHIDVVLWTRTGGMRSLDTVFLRWQLSAEHRRRLDEQAGGRATVGPLRPFLVPISALRPDARAEVVALLERHGLLQPPTNSST